MLQHPVRSIVLPMHDEEAVTISTAVKKALHNLLSPDSVWWQEEHLMHAPVFHATVQEVKGKATQASYVVLHPHTHGWLTRLLVRPRVAAEVAMWLLCTHRGFAAAGCCKLQMALSVMYGGMQESPL